MSMAAQRRRRQFDERIIVRLVFGRCTTRHLVVALVICEAHEVGVLAKSPNGWFGEFAFELCECIGALYSTISGGDRAGCARKGGNRWEVGTRCW